MTLILLHEPVASIPAGSARRFERVHMFPGRHLGEEEFEREQAYMDMRLTSLLRGRTASGIVHGLQLTLGPRGAETDGFVVNPGLAVDAGGRAITLYHPLHAEWRYLIDVWLDANGVDDPTGVYYLLLRRDGGRIDAPAVDPCQRKELDPTRDTRLVVTGTLGLHRLNIAPSALTSGVFSRELIENWVAADRVDGAFMTALGSAVPLALVAIAPNAKGQFHPQWISVEAGRYEALPASGYRVLLSQTGAAMRRVMERAALELGEGDSLADFLKDNLHLNFLPAAGQLPLDWLQNPDAVSPTLLWLPEQSASGKHHLGIDMVPVPEEAIPELLNRHIARRVIDVRQPAGDKIRLLLAVNEPDYRPDLLDIPQIDERLAQDVFRFYMRAYDAWYKWREQFDYLYYLEPSDEPPLATPEETVAKEKRVLDPAQFKQLDLPKPDLPPVVPLAFYEDFLKRAAAQLDPGNSDIPYPFDRDLKSDPLFAPGFYTKWLVDGAPSEVAPPAEDGLVIQYSVGLVELEAIENQARAMRARVEKTRDLLLLMRQQLDSQTVALAALAGGVAGDGSGLQVARWLPYADMQKVTPDVATTQAAPAPVTGVTGTGAYRTSFNWTAATTAVNPRLASKPQTFSALELGINANRLNLLSQIARQPVNKPAFEAKEYRFGVIDHISPEINEYAKAYFGMRELLVSLKDLFDATDASSLRSDLQRVGRADEAGEGPGDVSPFERSSRLESPSVLDNLATKAATANGVVDARKRSLLLTQYRYHALFKAGRILTQWIAICEARYSTLERRLQGKLSERTAKMGQLEKLAGMIRVARETLENLDRFRVEQLGDYGVAQRLLEEDWRRVYAVNKERSRILTTALRGLYYVRVRAAPVSAALADPLALRHGGGGDVIPGCDWEVDVDLPEALTPFFQTVCEIPMDDWVRLKPLHARLPAFGQLDFLGQIRQSRFKARPAVLPTSAGTGSLQARLQTVYMQNRAVMQQWSSFTLPALMASRLQLQAEAAKILSLEDLALVSGPLRKEAQDLKDRLEKAAACLLERLSVLPGSIRLQWGQLAEDDRIRVEDVSWWPGLERAEADDFNATRTVAELIAWWFAQLAPDAPANSRSAYRNMIRALLIHASLGDPQEIVHGSVHAAPGRTRVGERLQVKLNRAPAPGTRLQLLDPDQRVVALLAVEDHTPDSTRVSIVDLVQPEIRIDSRFRVVASKLTKQKL